MRALSLVVAAFMALAVAAGDAGAAPVAGKEGISPEVEAEAAIAASGDARAVAEAKAVADAEALANETPEAVSKSTQASLEEMLKRHSDAEKSSEDLKAAEKESAAAVENEKELDTAMNAQLEKEMAHSKAESVARQAVFDSQHRAYQKVVSKLVEQLDAVLDDGEESVEGSTERREDEKDERTDNKRMLLTLQAECAARVQRVLSHVYDAADAVASAGHLRYKARYTQRVAFDKAIRAAKKAAVPTIGFDMVNEIQKAVQAAREAWIGAAGVHMFDAAMAPAEARAEHMMALADAQQRQCSMLTIGDVQALVKHQKTVAAALRRKATGEVATFEDEEEEEEDEEEGDDVEGDDGAEEGDDVEEGDAEDEDEEADAPFPNDPCMWGITPTMSVSDITSQITGCRQSRDAPLSQGQHGQFPTVYARTAASAYHGIKVPHVMQAYGHMAPQAQWANSGLGAYAAQFGPYSQNMMAANVGAYNGYGANPYPQFGAAAYGSFAPNFAANNFAYGQYGMYPPHPSVGPSSADAAALAKASPVPAAGAEEKK